MKTLKQHKRVQHGFTLVEMAIVLAVIGLVIGAIAIAKDVQRNAEYQKIGNKFLYQWKAAYDQHYQRTGVAWVIASKPQLTWSTAAKPVSVAL